MCPKRDMLKVPIAITSVARPTDGKAIPSICLCWAFFEHSGQSGIGDGGLVRNSDACEKAIVHLVSAKTRCAKAAAERITEIRLAAIPGWCGAVRMKRC